MIVGKKYYTIISQSDDCEIGISDSVTMHHKLATLFCYVAALTDEI